MTAAKVVNALDQGYKAWAGFSFEAMCLRLIERADNCYSLCEIKFSQQEFVIDKPCAQVLRRKKDALLRHGKRGYTVFLVLITTYGVRRNQYAKMLIDRCVLLEDLFGR